MVHKIMNKKKVGIIRNVAQPSNLIVLTTKRKEKEKDLH